MGYIRNNMPLLPYKSTDARYSYASHSFLFLGKPSQKFQKSIVFASATNPQAANVIHIYVQQKESYERGRMRWETGGRG